MKRSFLLILIIGIVSFGVKAQDDATKKEDKEGWKYSGIFGLTASQVSFSNWSAGGENSYSLNGLVALNATYKKGKHLWTNDLGLAYGIMKQGEKEVRKTDDKFEFNSAYGYKATDVWYYSAVLNLKSQFTEGYKYNDGATPPTPDKIKISNLFAPGYLNLSLGMTYKPSDMFSVFIGPVSGKMTFVNDKDLANAGAFGVEAAEYDAAGNIVKEGKKSKSEFGGTIKAKFTKDIFENVNVLSKLTLFSSYTKNPQNIDVDWQLLVNFKINEWLSTNINLHLIYDDDIKSISDAGLPEGPKVQFKEVFGLGLNLKF